MRISDWSSDVCSSDLEAEYMVRASGYLASLEDFRNIPLAVKAGGTPILLGDVATIQLGPEIRRGLAELNGEGETAGGVVILRSGKNARQAISAVKAKLDELKASLPPGVEIVPTYDRSKLIDRRSEEHTSELQSLMRNTYAVFCLKKKKIIRQS